MTQTQLPNTEPAGAPDRRTDRDLQRAALGDLVTLSAECTAVERRVEQDHLAAVQGEDRRHQKVVADLDERYKSDTANARLKHAERVAAVRGQFDQDFAALKLWDQVGRDKADAEHSAAEKGVKEKLQQSTWLAESVFEAATISVRDELRKNKEKVGRQREALAAIDKKAAELLVLYGVAKSAKVPSGGAGAGAATVDVAPADAGKFYEERQAEAERLLVELGSLRSPRFFVGVTPFLALVLVLGVGAVAGQMYLAPQDNALNIKAVGTGLGAAVAFCIVVGIALRMLANANVRKVYQPLRRAVDEARAATEKDLAHTKSVQNERHARAVKTRDEEIKVAREQANPHLSKVRSQREAAVAAARAEYSRRLAQLEQRRDKELVASDQLLRQTLHELKHKYEADVKAANQRYADQQQQDEETYRGLRGDLERRWYDGLKEIQAGVDAQSNGQALSRSWGDAVSWQRWSPPKEFPATVRFGELEVDLPTITDQVPQHLKLPDRFSVPAALAFPRQASLLLQSDRSGRDQSIRTMQMVMMRLLTSIPPGRVRFTIIDPVGLGQNFAGFMHLADFDEALVGSRIWTDAEHIENRLADLTEHMETVIQKYLRNEFETIDDYNAQAGELAEPYRFLVIADLPTNFTEDSYRRLAAIASTGARCGVYTLVHRDLRVPLPGTGHMDELESHSVNLVFKDGRFTWKDEVFRQFPLSIDEPPDENVLTASLQVVGKHAKDAKRVEVSFDSIAPPPDKLWSASATDELRVPIGRLGATRLQQLRLGRGVAQHALIAGKTGSGKSTLLHALVTNLAMWYAPDEVEFYLIDFKKGVEFKTYATHELPHARAIAVESDREFGLSVLQRIDAELTRRGEMFRKLGVQDLAAYRQLKGVGGGGSGVADSGDNDPRPTTHNPQRPLPRTLLIIDEFQEFFSEDDKLGQDAALLLDRLVRQGRAFGIHVLLGSQTIGGSSGLARSTLGQMAVRIALQTSEADSQMILGDNNSAARLLSRPGEAIYNDQGGLIEANSPFQIAWLPDEKREVYLQRVHDRAKSSNGNGTRSLPIVFEGNAPADIRKNQKLAESLASSRPSTLPTAPRAYLGDPVAIKDPTSLVLRRQSGANAIIVGQQEESAMALLTGSIISLAAQHPANQASFYVLDGTPADSPLAGTFERIKPALPHAVTIVDWRGTGDTIAALAKEMHRRHEEQPTGAPSVYVIVYGLQRYRVLRKEEDSYSFSMSDEEKKPQPGKLFAELLRDGPPMGIHTLCWADTSASIERTLERATLREFDHRVLFQMSATDSSNLIDSPAANKLGFHRALAFSEEQGVIEKFRPYALPPQDWLEQVGAALRR
jgi:S-DNA-T family DNA segregation ATPase FtsK/SpoIIIE